MGANRPIPPGRRDRDIVHIRQCEGLIEPSPRQAAGNVLPVTAVLRSTVRIKNRFSVRSLTPAASDGECARYRGSTFRCLSSGKNGFGARDLFKPEK